MILDPDPKRVAQLRRGDLFGVYSTGDLEKFALKNRLEREIEKLDESPLKDILETIVYLLPRG